MVHYEHNYCGLLVIKLKRAPQPNNGVSGVMSCECNLQQHQ